MTKFQAVAWHGEDIDNQYVIHIFGRTEDGKSVHVETPFEPYFFVKGPASIVAELKPASSAIIRRKDLWGFRNQEMSQFVKLGFKTLAEMKECRPRGHKVYEKNLDPVLRFMHRTDIKSTGWIQVPESATPGYASTCDVDFQVSDWRNLKPVDRDDIAPLRVASLDIESFSESGAFPNAFNSSDVCFQVAITTREFGKDGYFARKCLCVKETSGPDCESFDTEREMLERLGEYLRELDPDIVTGWNIFGFDLEYLYTRTVVTAAGSSAHYWGRLKEKTNELVIKHLASNALGSNDMKMVPMPGRYVFDMFQDVKREHKLESYSLNNVSKEFLKDTKIDMPVKEMFARFREGDPAKLGEVADYCIKDTELPHRIAEKLCLIQNLIEMAKATWVPLSYLSERGQQIKVFSQLARKARELGFMIPTLYPKDGQEDKFQGATVLDAQTGAYYQPITALDFASLYPSIMRAHNLCYSSLVMDPKFANIPGVVYEQYGPYRFAQNAPSLLPVILNELAAFRKKAKKLMAAAEGTPMWAVYNGQQLAYKIAMNSIYGFTGATKGMLPCVAIASTVTMRGRQMIEETKNYVEEHFPGAKVRYGDSVMPETPVLVKIDGIIKPIKIENLAKVWESYSGFMKDGSDKESSEVSGVESLTHKGWQPIKRVIRHKCQKKIYRIQSPYGTVDVTEDHSLLDSELNILKPRDLKQDTKLLHYGPDRDGTNHVTLLHESWDGYVYDIETEAGTFQAGVGQLIVKNTDSVMVEFDVQGRKGQDAIDYSWVQGELAAEACTKLFKAPNDLELEKVYCPYFLYSKKRYAAKMYEKKGESVVFKKIDVKGLQVVRRDTCIYVRGVLKQLLDLVLNSDDPRPAIEYAREAARKLLKGKVDSNELLMSKQLGSDYKSRQPHVEVRNKIRERAPGSEPQNGDRVSFLVAKGAGLLCEKAEDPSWMKEKNIPVDYKYYFEHQLCKPVCDLLEPLVGADSFQTVFKSLDFLTTPSIQTFFKPKQK
jgi:DNA polymerase delta subunit 1